MCESSDSMMEPITLVWSVLHYSRLKCFIFSPIFLARVQFIGLTRGAYWMSLLIFLTVLGSASSIPVPHNTAIWTQRDGTVVLKTNQYWRLSVSIYLSILYNKIYLFFLKIDDRAGLITATSSATPWQDHVSNISTSSKIKCFYFLLDDPHCQIQAYDQGFWLEG